MVMISINMRTHKNDDDSVTQNVHVCLLQRKQYYCCQDDVQYIDDNCDDVVSLFDVLAVDVLAVDDHHQ